ncbi:hypothetical protein IFR05_010238 [Cadophora sp. M221]|nr:hypothetical protein IFR05_010238 [Cadophora sp. M221]
MSIVSPLTKGKFALAYIHQLQEPNRKMRKAPRALGGAIPSTASPSSPARTLALPGGNSSTARSSPASSNSLISANKTTSASNTNYTSNIDSNIDSNTASTNSFGIGTAYSTAGITSTTFTSKAVPPSDWCLETVHVMDSSTRALSYADSPQCFSVQGFSTPVAPVGFDDPISPPRPPPRSHKLPLEPHGSRPNIYALSSPPTRLPQPHPIGGSKCISNATFLSPRSPYATDTPRSKISPRCLILYGSHLDGTLTTS